MRVLIAFDTFKDSLKADQACAIAAEAVLELCPDAEVILKPLADGGEGFCQILTSVAGGELVNETVLGPQGDPLLAHWGMVDLEDVPVAAKQLLGVTGSGKLAIIEMAQASGIESIPLEKRNPWIASTFGTGQLIEKTTRNSIKGIVLGLGGSATNDMGLGALNALGLICNDIEGNAIDDVSPKNWDRIESISGSVIQNLPPLMIACDVENPLLGDSGATKVFGAQKGLLSVDKDRLEELMDKLSNQLCSLFNKPLTDRDIEGSGAAGGIGFGLKAALGARFVPGFQLVEEWLDLTKEVEKADIIITGEGSYDKSSLFGKGPYAIVELAVRENTPVLLFAGRVTEEAQLDFEEKTSNSGLYQISPEGLDIADCLTNAPKYLKKAVLEALEKKRNL